MLHIRFAWVLEFKLPILKQSDLKTKTCSSIIIITYRYQAVGTKKHYIDHLRFLGHPSIDHESCQSSSAGIGSVQFFLQAIKQPPKHADSRLINIPHIISSKLFSNICSLYSYIKITSCIPFHQHHWLWSFSKSQRVPPHLWTNHYVYPASVAALDRRKPTDSLRGWWAEETNASSQECLEGQCAKIWTEFAC